MQYPQVVDTFRSYWPGERPGPQTVMHLSLTEAYRGAQRLVEQGGRLVPLNIPPGVHSGTRLYLPRTGRERSHVSEYCTVLVHDQPPFQRVGDDLALEWMVDVRRLIIGGEVQVPTLTGLVGLSIPAWTAPGTIVRVPGRGMPVLGRPSTYGDLCVHLRVSMPRDASDLERRLIADILGIQHWPQLPA